MKKTFQWALAALACATGTAALADVHHFNAQLTGAAEVPASPSTATGVATLLYDDQGTVDMGDDTWDFALSVFGLSAPASAYHIHGAALPSETAPVRVSLDAPPFVALVSGGTLLVGGDDIPAMMVPATPASPTNAGHPEMSFLDMLRNGLAYVNVHTPNFPAGEVRGQLVHVMPTAPIPEPSTYAFMLAGLVAVGALARRARR